MFDLVLAGLAVFAVGVCRGEASEPVSVQAAQRTFNDAYRQEDWPRAIEVGLDLVQMVPDNARVKYNLACVYALSGDSGSALHWLGRAAASGFAQLKVLDNDSDLASVRDRPGYSNVRSQIAENERQHLRDLNRKAAESPILIVSPPDHDPRRAAPLIIAFHGYGDRPENYPRFWSGPAAKYGAILAVPRGHRPVGGGFGWSEVDEADAVLQRTLDEVATRYEIDADRVIVTGFSQGGFIALALGVRHRNLFVGVIPMAAPYIPEIDAPPEVQAGDPRYFFIVGSRDRAVGEMRRAARDYEKAGYHVKLRVVPSTGHSMPRDSDRELAAALRWVLEE